MAFLPAALVTVLAFGVGAAAGYAPPATGEMAVVFPPWVSEWQGLAAIAAAGGKLVGPTRLANIVVVDALDAGFAGRVRARGALLLLAAHGLCSTTAPRPIGI